MMSIGCGVTKKKRMMLQATLSCCSKKDVPDFHAVGRKSACSCRYNRQSNTAGELRPRSCMIPPVTILAKAEAAFTATTNQLQPIVESLRKTFDARKQGLSGPQLKEADSLIALADSCIKMNQFRKQRKNAP